MNNIQVLIQNKVKWNFHNFVYIRKHIFIHTRWKQLAIRGPSKFPKWTKNCKKHLLHLLDMDRHPSALWMSPDPPPGEWEHMSGSGERAHSTACLCLRVSFFFIFLDMVSLNRFFSFQVQSQFPLAPLFPLSLPFPHPTPFTPQRG